MESIFKRAKFNHQRQEEGKSVDDFVTSLYCQLEHCCYGDFRDELIRDRTVMGLQDSTLSEKLQLDPTLMLETAITAARQIRKQQQVIRTDETPSNIDAIATKKPQATKAKPTRGSVICNHRILIQSQILGFVVRRCGKSGRIEKQQCPAKDAT